MGLGDDIRNKGDELSGKAKEGVGDATGDEQLKSEGRLQQGGAKFKQAVEDVKEKAAEKFNDLTDKKDDDAENR